MGERRGFFFKDDGSVEVRGMDEYRGNVIYRLVGWLRRCLAARKRKGRA